MNQKDEKIFKNFLHKTNDINETKLELYWLLPSLVISKKTFKNRESIQKFVEGVLEMKFADYVYNSRSILIGRILKKIHTMDLEDSVVLTNRLVEFLKDNIITNKEAKDKSKSNDTDFFDDWSKYLDK